MAGGAKGEVGLGGVLVQRRRLVIAGEGNGGGGVSNFTIAELWDPSSEWPEDAIGQSALPTLWGLRRSSTERRSDIGFR